VNIYYIVEFERMGGYEAIGSYSWIKKLKTEKRPYTRCRGGAV